MKKAVKKAVKKGNENNVFKGNNDGLMHPWTYKGQNVFRTYNGHVWARSSNYEPGDYMGKYNNATKVFDKLAVNPYED